MGFPRPTFLPHGNWKIIDETQMTGCVSRIFLESAFKAFLLKKGNILGISMGSSEGAGYANKDGNLMGWISELCYVRGEVLDLCVNLESSDHGKRKTDCSNHHCRIRMGICA